jgi:predicted RNA-binding protein
MKYWLCVTSEENWHVVKKRKIWGISERNRRQMDELKVGDMLIFYVKPKRTAGVYKVSAKPFVDNNRIFSTAGFSESETFPHRVKIQAFAVPKEPVPFDFLVSKLTFISNKKKWPGYLRKAMQAIPKEDYEKILTSLKVG